LTNRLEAQGSRVGSAAHVGIITRYAFLNYFRARRFYVMLAIVLLMSALLTASVGYYRPALFGFAPSGSPMTADQSRLVFYSFWWAGFVNLIVIMSAAFFGGDAISGEYQNKTGYFLLPNPIRRSSVYVGKYIAALAASVVMLGLFALIALINGMYYFGAVVPLEFALSVLYALIYLVAAMSLTFLFSSAFKSSSIAVLMTVILLLFVFNIVDLIVGTIARVEPWFSITYAEGIVGRALSSGIARGPGGGGGGFNGPEFAATVPEGLAIMAVYFLVTGAVGLLLFERKGFT
jgi:ABC-2 type transport system permease protein